MSFRKIIFFIIMIFVYISCSDESRSDVVDNKSQINPPSWIIGKWKLNSGAEYSYTFVNGDIIINSAGISMSIKPVADVGKYSQTSTDTSFTFTLHNTAAGDTYRFRKVSSTKLVSDLGLGGGYDYEFVKQ
ncbi:Uncharacterised protein [Chryseobacterium taklimakanense]|uniref:Lipocalin-like domain-containing protein n=1 Tax=Chryseobacterium taklimakanense TaxID=536441 RepID=A0A239X477_9FLAO|nr:hypothetical protein [Chryseobacterium taklimakanense]SNV41452.1 Uncharacterised protein [Chryseobacterium taklimakanense]